MPTVPRAFQPEMDHPGWNKASAPISMHQFFMHAMVARSLNRSEVMTNKEAAAAVEKEWGNLRSAEYVDDDGKKRKGVWDEENVMEWSEV